jgi:hypothetical protein
MPVVVKVTLAGDPDIEAELPGQNADGSLALPASEAETTGAAHFEDGKKCIGFWTETTDTVKWKFRVTKPGTYRLFADLACQDDSAGSLVSATFENQERQYVVKGTGGWDKFTTVDFGTITLTQSGDASIIVKARMKPGYAVMNLRSLKIAPINAR